MQLVSRRINDNSWIGGQVCFPVAVLSNVVRMVYIWDTTSRDIKYKLPGHNGTVSEVDFHPKEPIIGSGGSDNKIFLGEIEKYS